MANRKLFSPESLNTRVTYTWLAITLLLSLPSAYFHLLPPLCCNPWFLLNMTLFSRTPPLFIFVTPKYLSLICLIYLSLPNLYFYTIRSITIFLKVLYKVDFRVLIQNINYFLWLTYSWWQNCWSYYISY